MTPDRSDPPAPWRPDLDALSAAPGHHRLLLENDRVRILETPIPPGDVVPVDTRRWPSALYIMGWRDFVRRDADGVVVADSRAVEVKPAAGSAHG